MAAILHGELDWKRPGTNRTRSARSGLAKSKRSLRFFWVPERYDIMVYIDLIHAIEVKNSDRIRLQDLQGLKTFRQDYPES